MNTITKKILLIVFALLLSACVHYPRHDTYYPGARGYRSEYTIMHRNYYGKRPDYYQRSHGKRYFPRHDRYNFILRPGNNYRRHQPQPYRRHNRYPNVKPGKH